MDIQERTTQLVVRALLHSAQVLPYIHDSFSYRSLEDAIQECLASAIQDGSHPGNIAESAAGLQRCLQDIGVAGGIPIRTLLLAERHALLLLVHAKSFSQASLPHIVRAPSQRSAANGVPAEATTVGNGILTDGMRVVFDAVKDTQPARAKDVIQQCGSLSGRTVKRRLKELVEEGHVLRDTSDGSVRYRIPAD